MQNVYLITGASSDVGCALIRRLADHDSQALIVAQGAGDLNRLAELCREFPGRIRTYDVDLTDENALNAFIADVQASCPAPTHLVHLPALRVINTKFKKFDEERFELDLSVQVRSAVKLCKTFVPLMAKAKRGRVLFMLTSYLIGVPPKNTAAYIMAKSALGRAGQESGRRLRALWRNGKLRGPQHDGDPFSGRHQRSDRTGQRRSQSHGPQRPGGGCGSRHGVSAG